MNSEKNEWICPCCGFRSSSDTKTESKSEGSLSPNNAVTCAMCGMVYSSGDVHLRVEGKSSEEVKNVASSLLKQISDEKKEEIEFNRKRLAQRELEADILKRLVVTGGFWIGIFLGIGYFMIQISNTQAQWYRFIVILFCLPIFFTLVGAFVLKTTSALKEENFMKLVRMTLQINLKGLQSITKEKNENSKPS